MVSHIRCVQVQEEWNSRRSRADDMGSVVAGDRPQKIVPPHAAPHGADGDRMAHIRCGDEEAPSIGIHIAGLHGQERLQGVVGLLLHGEPAGADDSGYVLCFFFRHFQILVPHLDGGDVIPETTDPHGGLGPSRGGIRLLVYVLPLKKLFSVVKKKLILITKKPVKPVVVMVQNLAHHQSPVQNVVEKVKW